MPVEVVELAHHLDLAPALARWHHDEWRHLYRGWDLAAATAELTAMTTPGRIPTTYVAFAADGRAIDDVLGSVSLIDDDELEGYRDVGPWLASLYVVPGARGRGVGRALTQMALERARSLGVARLHLFTAGQEAFYAALGWRVVGHAPAGDETATVMAMATAPHAARRALASHWCSDPDVATAYSYLRPGGTPNDRDRLAAPIARGLVLAGEATWRDHPGTMHGAWFSGERAARIVLERQIHSAIVVGAGLAGIAAARVLRAAGVEVIVLEAGATAGGRVRSDTTLGGPANLGAAWTHGDGGNPIAAAASALGFGSDDSTWRHVDAFVAGRGRVPDEVLAGARRRHEAFEEQLDLVAAHADAGEVLGPVARRLVDESGTTGVERLVLSGIVRAEFENLYAAPLDDLSLAHAQEPFRLPGVDALVLGSLGAVATYLADGLDVRCGEGVVAVDQSGDSWRVRTDGSEHHDADAVIVTVPIGVLHAGRIRFSPPLPDDVIAAASRIGAGRVAKVFATFDSVFWGAAGAFHVVAEHAVPLALWVDVTRVIGRPALCAFATGDHAVAVEAMREDELCALVDDTLAASVLAR